MGPEARKAFIKKCKDCSIGELETNKDPNNKKDKQNSEERTKYTIPLV